MAQGPAQCSKGDAGIAAGSFGDRSSRLKQLSLVTDAQNVQRHAILDAARHVEVLGLRVHDARLPPEFAANGQKWRVPHKMRQSAHLLVQLRVRHGALLTTTSQPDWP